MLRAADRAGSDVTEGVVDESCARRARSSPGQWPSDGAADVMRPAVLVTGGAGYVGSFTVQRFLAAGWQVVVLDTLELGHAGACEGAELVVGDVRDVDLVAQTLRRFDIGGVVHFAAYKSAAASVHDPARYFENNVVGTLRVLEAMAMCGVPHIVFSSTCAVYGTPEQLPVDERHRLAPESPYGESKRMCEDMLRCFDTSHGVRHVALRYFNAAGAALDGSLGEDWSRSANLVPVAMRAALGVSPPVHVFGTDYPTPDGTAIRDYVHVLDLAEAHVQALEHLRLGGPSMAINLGTATGSSVREVLDAIEAVSGAPVPAVEDGRRAGDPVAVFADNSCALDVLGWRPKYALDDIVRTAWEWHAGHRDGLGPSPEPLR